MLKIEKHFYNNFITLKATEIENTISNKEQAIELKNSLFEIVVELQDFIDKQED